MKRHAKARARLSTDRHVVDGECHRSKLSVPLLSLHIADYGEGSYRTFFRLAQDLGYFFLTPSHHGREEEKRERARIKAIKGNHKILQKHRQKKAARDAATLASVQTLDAKPGIAHGMSSSRSTVHHPKDRKPSASSLPRAQVWPIRFTPDAPSIRPAGPDHTTRERKTVVERSPLIPYSRRPDYTLEVKIIEVKITLNGPGPSSHRGNDSRNELHSVEGACQTDLLLLKADPRIDGSFLRREDAA